MTLTTERVFEALQEVGPNDAIQEGGDDGQNGRKEGS